MAITDSASATPRTDPAAFSPAGTPDITPRDIASYKKTPLPPESPSSTKKLSFWDWIVLCFKSICKFPYEAVTHKTETVAQKHLQSFVLVSDDMRKKHLPSFVLASDDMRKKRFQENLKSAVKEENWFFADHLIQQGFRAFGAKSIQDLLAQLDLTEYQKQHETQLNDALTNKDWVSANRLVKMGLATFKAYPTYIKVLELDPPLIEESLYLEQFKKELQNALDKKDWNTAYAYVHIGLHRYCDNHEYTADLQRLELFIISQVSLEPLRTNDAGAKAEFVFHPEFEAFAKRRQTEAEQTYIVYGEEEGFTTQVASARSKGKEIKRYHAVRQEAQAYIDRIRKLNNERGQGSRILGLLRQGLHFHPDNPELIALEKQYQELSKTLYFSEAEAEERMRIMVIRQEAGRRAIKQAEKE